MKKLAFCWSLLVASAHADVDFNWLNEAKNRVYPQTTEWLRECLKNEIKEKKEQTVMPGTRCLVSTSDQVESPSLLIFISFSVPEATWLSLSKEAAFAGGGIFVLQGLPNNSFVELAQRLFHLKEQGLNIQVEIDPLRFRKYGISKVPTFVVQGSESFDELSGHVSLAYALETMAHRGETLEAKQLYDKSRHIDPSMGQHVDHPRSQND